MERLIILVGLLYKSVALTKYFLVPLIGRCMPLVGVVRWPVESPLQAGLGNDLEMDILQYDVSYFHLASQMRQNKNMIQNKLM